MCLCAARQTYIPKYVYDCVTMYIITSLSVMDSETEKITDVCAPIASGIKVLMGVTVNEGLENSYLHSLLQVAFF